MEEAFVLAGVEAVFAAELVAKAERMENVERAGWGTEGGVL